MLLDDVTLIAPAANESAFMPLAKRPLMEMLPELVALIAPSVATTMPSTKSPDEIIPKGPVALFSVMLPAPKNKIPGCPLAAGGAMLPESELTSSTVVPGGGFSTPADWLPEQVTVPTPVHGSGPA
ncbi:MAG: hypothetical protein WA417_14055 [Stellaceae bacterium]